MIRNAIGAVLAVVGAAAAVWSPFHAWYDGRLGRYYEIDDLFGGITSSRADPWTSLLLPLAFAALVALVGLVLRSRAAVALAGVVVLGFTVLWMVRQGQAAGSLTVSGDGGRGLGPGTGLALGGGLLLLLAAAVMAGRRRGRMLGGHDAAYARGESRRRGARQAPVPGPDDPAHPGHPDDASAHRPPGAYQEPSYQDPYQDPHRGPYQDPHRGPYQDPYQEPHQDPYQEPHQDPYQEPHRDPHAQDTRTHPHPHGRGGHPDDRPS
ncbi:hypothetical protein [Streptomyces roseolilacinus]|uniref:hypothetical protein n=1 Tax=Streptomyces roseolilacinus TaxID=66904 RepID=UPI0037FF562D